MFSDVVMELSKKTFEVIIDEVKAAKGVKNDIDLDADDMKSNYKITGITDTMEARDPRLAIQLPQDVITAGVTPNPRNK
jgi:hypothetical protein